MPANSSIASWHQGVACSSELVSPEGSAYGCVRICLDEVHLPKQMHSSCWVSVHALLLLPPPVAFLFLESGGDFLLHLGGEEIFCYSHIRGWSSDMVAPKAPDQLGQGLTWAESWIAQTFLLGILQTGMHPYRSILQKAFLDWHWG